MCCPLGVLKLAQAAVATESCCLAARRCPAGMFTRHAGGTRHDRQIDVAVRVTCLMNMHAWCACNLGFDSERVTVHAACRVACVHAVFLHGMQTTALEAANDTKRC